LANRSEQPAGLPCIRIGKHRRIRRRDLLAYSRPQLRREEEQSLWLHHAVAGHLVADPAGVLAQARAGLARRRRAHPDGSADVWFDRWQEVLDQGPSAVLNMIISRSPLATELRQNTPFGGVLSQDERLKVLEAFRAVRPYVEWSVAA
jgi:hypothetical protein